MIRWACMRRVLLQGAEERPAALLFSTDGVKLCCEGSPVLDQLRGFESQGVPAIMEAMARADKVVSV